MNTRRCLLAILIACSLTAQTSSPADTKLPWSQQFSGYFKNLAASSRSYFTEDQWTDNLGRLRLTYDGRYKSWLQVHADYDNEVHAGNLIGLRDFDTVRQRQSSAWLDLEHAILDKDHVYWDTSLYRGYISLRSGAAALTLGRQRIGWGTARFWSPMDVFNPISPLQVEPDERQGVDAALLQFTSPGDLRWSLVHAPQAGFRRSSSALRLSRTIHNYDFDVTAGRFARDWMAGADLAGQIRGAGIRGELTYRWRHAVPGSGSIATNNALRLVVGADYAFSNSLYLVGEYFYNQGQPDLPPNGVFDPSLLLRFSNEIFTLHRHFVSSGATYDLTPLWVLEAYVVGDVEGSSAVVLPRLKHSLSANTDLNFGAQLFASARGGEFHGLSNLVYVEFAFHFR